MPLTDSAARRAVCHGSSEMYSKLRPLRGSRARLAPPASCTLKPRLLASRPIAPPEARASAGLKLAPRAMHAGMAVAVSPSRLTYPGFVTPMLASLMCNAGTPRRGTPGVYAALIFVPSGMRSSRTGAKCAICPIRPITSEKRSSSVSCSSTSRARASAVAAPAGESVARAVETSFQPPGGARRKPTQGTDRRTLRSPPQSQRAGRGARGSSGGPPWAQREEPESRSTRRAEGLRGRSPGVRQQKGPTWASGMGRA